MPATYEPIASVSLSSTAATISFTSIPGTYTDLVVAMFARGSNTNAPNLDVDFNLNSDTGSNYSRTWLYEDGAAKSLRGSNMTYLALTYPPSATATSNVYSSDVLHFMSYANTNVNKTVLAAAATPTNYTVRAVGLWRSTSAITSMTFTARSSTFASGTTASLYGIKAA